MMKLALRYSLAAIILVLCIASPATAGPLEDADAAFAKKDYATALRLYRMLADQNNAAAQWTLGSMYFTGDGTPRNDAEALKWIRRAADQGNIHALINLALAYREGAIGVQRDLAEAARLFSRAAEQGNGPAQSMLGHIYQNGRGVPQNLVRAYMWFSLSAAGGTRSAADNREKVAKLMTPAQIAEAEKLAREWKRSPPAPR